MRPEYRDNRPRRFPDQHGRRASPRVPELPDGRLLHLGPGEWTHTPGDYPDGQVVLRVAAAHPERSTSVKGMVWLSGHRVTCAGSTSTCRTPCVELLASVAALWRAAGR